AVVLNVWATWCGPCRVEFPEFVRYSRDKAGEGVAVRFLSVDESGDLARVQQFLVEHGVSGRTYLTAEGTDIVAALAAPNRWAYGIPVTLIYGPDGELRDFWEGTVNYDFLDAKVQRVLAAAGETAAAGYRRAAGAERPRRRLQAPHTATCWERKEEWGNGRKGDRTPSPFPPLSRSPSSP